MHQLVKSWINGNQEYYTGIALLKACGASDSLYVLLKQGATHANKTKLKEFLMQYYEQSKTKNHAAEIRESTTTTTQKLDVYKRVAEHNGNVPGQQSVTTNRTTNNTIAGSQIHQPTNSITQVVEQDFSQTPLYIACKKEADNLYKELMNNRAVLFAGVRNILPHEDANTPDRIETRRKPCIDIAIDFQRVSKLYDRADYVKKNGKLPFTNAEVIETNVDGIPDALLKQNIDNLRKNLNKLKKKEQTPDRVMLIQSHEEKLNLLLSRWQLLKLEQ
jgi:hypothetical protein